MRRTLGLTVVMLMVVGCGAAGPSTSSPPTATPQSQPDPGTIWFGTAVGSGLTMTSHADSFAASALIGWVAVLSDTPNDTSVKVTLAQQAAGGGETVLGNTTVDVSDPQANVLSHSPDDTLGSAGAGTYVLRYIRPSDGKVLAQGTVTITP